MKDEGLVILVIALVLFAMFMFVVSFTFFKKFCNERRLNDDYKKDIDDEDDDDGSIGVDIDVILKQKK